ncbi:ornithine carbamoyltransferase [bacterium]
MSKSDLVDINSLSVKNLNDIMLMTEIIKNDIASSDIKLLNNKTLAMIFQKASTRTRVSFETGMYQLGGHALFLNSDDIQLGRGETVSDTAKTLSQFVDCIMIRTFEHEYVQKLAEFSDVPVINGLSDLVHPCQVLSDFYTVIEHFKWRINADFSSLKIAYIGDGNNISNSLINLAGLRDINLSIACPVGYEPNKEIFEFNKAKMKKSEIQITTDPNRAVVGAHVVYTDVWISMGKEEEKQKRLNEFAAYQVNANLMSKADKNAVFMHCLPAHRAEEVSGEVMDGVQSIVFKQAGNRMHVQKAILAYLLGYDSSILLELLSDA